MSKLFKEAVRLEVEEGIQHKPTAFLYKGKRKQVKELLKQWRVVQGWWRRPVEREYRNLLTGVWYLQRIYD
jgi:hypothetical protein